MAADLIQLAQSRFGKLSEAELRLLRGASSGDAAYCGPKDVISDPSNNPADSDQWGSDREIRGLLVRWLCTVPDASGRVAPRGIQVIGAKLLGTIDLAYATIPFPIGILRCQIAGDVNLTRAKVAEVCLCGTRARCILAEGIEVRGSFLLQDGFSSYGEVRLIAAHIGGTLSCEGSSLTDPGGCEQQPSGFSNAQLLQRALRADQITVGESVFLRHGFTAEGAVQLNGARIGGQLSLRGATLRNINGSALDAEGIEVAGTVLLDGEPSGERQFNAQGEIDLAEAKIGGSLICQNGTFGEVNLTLATIKGALVWAGIRNREKATLDLTTAYAGTLADEQSSWPIKGHLWIDGFVYDRFVENPTADVSGAKPPESPSDAQSRLDWIGRQKRFSLQPYRQLAKVLHEKGDEDGSQEVLFQMETLARAQERGRLPLARRVLPAVGDGLSRETIAYGLRPLRVLWWEAAFVLVGTICYRRARSKRAMVPTDKEAFKEFRDHHIVPGYYPPFNSFIYTVENCVPLLNLGQNDRWQPGSDGGQHNSRAVPRFLRALRWFLIIVGWVGATFLVAGLSGIVKTK